VRLGSDSRGRWQLVELAFFSLSFAQPTLTVPTTSTNSYTTICSFNWPVGVEAHIQYVGRTNFRLTSAAMPPPG
jgi:hypothetical protein